MRTNKRMTQLEKEMREWKAEAEGWWKEKANLLQMFFDEGKRWKEEKEDLHARIKELQENHHTGIQAFQERVSALERELAETKMSRGLEEGEFQPSVIEEINGIKEQVQKIKDVERQHEAQTSSWVDVISKTQKKMEEAERWIEVAKKGKGKEIEATPTPTTIINMTLEEEQRRKTRALHVRVTGLKDRDDVEMETKELCSRMGIEATYAKAWRVGKKREGNGELSKERALIIRFPTMEAKKDFLKRRPTLKKPRIFMGDDLTLSQLAHMNEVMPEIKAAREKGKVAFYREERVVIMERRPS